MSNLQDNEKPGSLRYAIDETPTGRTITFDPSLHGSILLTRGDLNIGKNLMIRGPGAGILSISSGKSGYIVHVAHDTTVVISGLTFKDSTTNLGFIVNEGRLTLSNSTVSHNTASGQGSNGGYGGGIYNKGGTLTLSNSTVSHNMALDGGGILNSGTLMLSNSTVSGNTATSYSGGGIDNMGTLTLSNSIVLGNTAIGSGGGISNSYGAMLTLSNSTVSGNTAIGSGGGISNNFGSLTLSNSTVSHNMSQHDSGGIFNGGMLTLSNSTISGNMAMSEGGGIENVGSLMLSNSTISGNTSYNGGGIAISNQKNIGMIPVRVMLLYCTVYGNTANVGGGIWVDKQSQVTMGASIVAGNNAHTDPDIVGPLTTLGYNLVGDRSGVTFLGPPKVQSTDVLEVSLTKLRIDPLLRDNGGLARPHTWTHALLPGSPAIDTIPLDACHVTVAIENFLGTPIAQYPIIIDQRGMKRPDGNEHFCDIGSFEYMDSV